MRRVLIVDDEPAVLTALQLAFDESPAFEVHGATSAEDAMAQVRARVFELVLTDKNLPGRSGLELASWLRTEHPEVAVILITGYSTGDSRRQSEALALDAYLEKPFLDLYEIPRLAERVIAKRSARG